LEHDPAIEAEARLEIFLKLREILKAICKRPDPPS
jgi:hypothetical protein